MADVCVPWRLVVHARVKCELSRCMRWWRRSERLKLVWTRVLCTSRRGRGYEYEYKMRVNNEQRHNHEQCQCELHGIMEWLRDFVFEALCKITHWGVQGNNLKIIHLSWFGTHKHFKQVVGRDRLKHEAMSIKKFTEQNSTNMQNFHLSIKVFALIFQQSKYTNQIPFLLMVYSKYNYNMVNNVSRHPSGRKYKNEH